MSEGYHWRNVKQEIKPDNTISNEKNINEYTAKVFGHKGRHQANLFENLFS